MKKMLFMGAMALISTVAACGTQDQPANDVAVENDMNAMMADPSNPFGQAEMAMDQAMTAAVGVNATDSWARKMIEHHKGAVEMSRIFLAQKVAGHVADMAQKTIDKQTKEIAELQKLVASGSPDAAGAALYQPAAMAMHNAMMAANGADVSDTFVRKMLEHHRGAIAMSDVAMANGASGAVRAQIQKTKSEQQKEIEHIEGMLSGTASAAAEPATAAPAPTATAKPSTAAAKSPSPKPAPAKPKPAVPTKPAPDPHAGHDMNNMQD